MKIFKSRLKLLKGTRFTSFLFIAISFLIGAGIIFGANYYYDIDTGKIMVQEIQRIVKSGTTALEVVGITKLGSDTNRVEFAETGDLTFYGTADTIAKSDAPLTIQTTGQNLTIKTVTSGVLAMTSAGALNLNGGSGSTIDFPNFDVASTGHITVQPEYGLDTNAAGVLALGNTTSTTINIGNTAATAINIGAGGALTRAINIGTGTGVDTINIGTGGTGADIITIGGGAGTVAINSGDWKISTTGDLSGIGGITADQWSIASSTGNFTTAGDVAINGGDLTTTATTFNLLNSGASTINFGGAATAMNIGSSAGLTVTAPGALTIQFADGVTNAFLLRGSTPFTYLEINADGKVTLSSRGNQDLVFDAGSGAIRAAAGDTFYVDGIAVGGEGTLIGVVPIFGFELPVQTATTSYVQISKVVENYPFPAATTGTIRAHKLIFRYAASSTAAINWRVSTPTGATYSAGTLPVTESNNLDKGNAFITNVAIPSDGTDWWLDITTPDVPSVVRVYQIFLAAFNVKQ